MQIYSIPELLPRVDWTYFYFAWGVKDGQPEAAEIRREGERLLRHLSLNGLRVYAALRILPAYAEGDDLVVGADAPRRLAFLRQQHVHRDAPCLSLVDFIAPRSFVAPHGVSATQDVSAPRIVAASHGLVASHDSGAFSSSALPAYATSVGLYATSVGATHDCPCCTGDLLLLQTVKDRLAEAAAEAINDEYERQMGLRGIRPAVGYPSLPDQSFIFDLAQLLPFAELGIRLTENGMMQPHASTCGLIFGHPAARYFAVGPVGDDQLADYARRRVLSPKYLRKFLPR